MIKVLQIGNPILTKKSEDVYNTKNLKVQAIIDNMLDICYKKEKTTGGLSAPQIGINSKICIIRRVDKEEKLLKNKKIISSKLNRRLWEVVINPKVLKIGKNKSFFWEGCLSVNHGKVFGPVKRPSLIKIQYLNREGELKSITAFDFFAHIMQHELDHLKGILFVKYIKDPENLWSSKNLDKYLDKNDEFPDIVS
jgi:peptide deformylase